MGDVVSEKITIQERFGYGLGDLASNLFWMQFVIFLSYFYTDVFGLAPAAVAGMFVAVRIWDSVNDPIVGVLADRTKSRWGKFRPYLLWGALPFAIVGALTFITPDLSPKGKLTYAYLTYGLMVLVYTVVNIPYSSLMGVVSPDSSVRTRFSQMRFIMAFTGALIVKVATLPLVDQFGAADRSVIEAQTGPNETIVVAERGNGSSRLEISALMPTYEEPGFLTRVGIQYGVVDERELGRFTRKKTFYVNTEDYFVQSGIPYQESRPSDPFETIRYTLSGFGEEVIPLRAVFPKDDATLEGFDFSKARFEIKVVNEQRGFAWTIGWFAVVAALLFWATFATTKERVQPPKNQKSSALRDLGDLITNVPWLILFVLGIVTLFHVCLRNGSIVYWCKYNLGNEKLSQLFLIAGSFSNLASMFLVGPIERLLGKKAGYALLMFLTTLFTFAFGWIPGNQIGLLLTIHVLINLSFGPTSALVWAMYTDAADYGEWKNGRRATGLVMSACTMAQKLGYTLGGALAMLVLTRVGYEANAAQSPEALAGIKGMVSWMAGIPCAFGFVLILFYPLTARRLKEIQSTLIERRAGEE